MEKCRFTFCKESPLDRRMSGCLGETRLRMVFFLLALMAAVPMSADQGYAVLTDNGTDVVINNVTYAGEGKTLTFYYGTPTGSAGTDYYDTDNISVDPGWYSDSSEGQVLYRLYNPNAVAGAHHYTTSASERDKLISLGWRYEGTAWYGGK